MSILKIPTARIFEPLLQPARYKGAFGGRGSGKSHFFGELLVERCQAERGTSAVCIREAQRSLGQSSKRLIESKIASLAVGNGFRIFSDKIETPGDGIVIFRGMQDHTAETIKSLEGFGIAWVDEAQNLSARSLSLLRPTIRAERSELWASWNPRRKSDAIDTQGGPQDLQRHPQWGVPDGSFVPAFIGSASNHLGYVTALTPVPLALSEIGGGAVNAYHWLSDGRIDIDGRYRLSRQNHANIVQGFSDGLAASKPPSPFNDYGFDMQPQNAASRIGDGKGIGDWISSLAGVDPEEAIPAIWPPAVNKPVRYLGKRIE